MIEACLQSLTDSSAPRRDFVVTPRRVELVDMLLIENGAMKERDSYRG